MYLATVVGQVWATRKESTLDGLRFLVVQPWVKGSGALPEDGAETFVAVDTIGADVGERVLVVMGRAARHAIGKGHDVGFQTAIVGVVDGAEIEGEGRVAQLAEDDRKS